MFLPPAQGVISLPFIPGSATVVGRTT
jgi:hypothetical protein